MRAGSGFDRVGVGRDDAPASETAFPAIRLSPCSKELIRFRSFWRAAVIVVSPIDHAVLHAAILEIAGGKVLLRPTTAPGPDGSRLYGIRLADGDFARICVDAKGEADFTVFDRHLRRFVADLHVASGMVVGSVGGMTLEGQVSCGGIDVGDLVGALCEAVAFADGAFDFSYGRRLAQAA
jgi:hypothetical protein